MVGRWLLLPFLSAAAFAQEFPLPTDRTTILSREGATYFVEGRQTIGWGTTVTVQRGQKIVGRPDSVLVVEGTLQIRGVAGSEVILEDLRIEPAEKFDEIRLDTALFLGGHLKTGEKPVAGKIIVENTDLGTGVPFEVSMTGGAIDCFNSTFMDPVRIRGVPPEGKRCTLKLNLNGCFYNWAARRKESQRNAHSGFEKGLFLTGVPDALVRNCRMAGDRTEFVDCEKLTFDGNRVNSAEILFKQTQPGCFKDTKLQKSDIYTGKVVFEAPAGKERDQIPVDKCWFQGLTKKEEIAERVIRDGDDDPACGVVVVFRKILDRPLELAGKQN
jgi:hypothetical protein